MREHGSTVSTPPDSTPSATPDGPIDGTPHAGREGARPRGLAALVAVVTICVVAAVAFGVWAFGSSDDGGSASGASGADHGDHLGGDAHAGHGGGEVLEGCDAAAINASMMMFDPFVADELLGSGCPWPYFAGVDVDGGAEDSSIAAVFEPRRYAEVYDLLAAERLGMCAVSRLADPEVNGLVFGFRTLLQPGGCVDGVASVELDVREYSTRAWRDTAAGAMLDAPGVDSVVVLGRWLVTTRGDDAAAAAALLTSIGAMDGAVTLDG